MPMAWYPFTIRPFPMNRDTRNRVPIRDRCMGFYQENRVHILSYFQLCQDTSKLLLKVDHLFSCPCGSDFHITIGTIQGKPMRWKPFEGVYLCEGLKPD